MRFGLLYIVILISLTSSQKIFAQREYDNWHFGALTGLQFTGGSSPLFLPAPFDTEEGCTTMSDSLTGELLFTSDGKVVYDKTLAPMPNGSELRGGYSSAQSALAVPVPEKRGQYLLFTVGDLSTGQGNPGAFVNEINMNERNGLGDVNAKNIPLLDASAEKLAGTRGCDWNSYWVVIHHMNQPVFYAFKVTTGGVTDTVISQVGAKYTPGTVGGVYGLGCIKFSGSGTQLAMATKFSSTQLGKGCVELFDFNLRTGVISNPRIIAEGFSYYGIAFSPDERQMFVTTEDDVRRLGINPMVPERLLYTYFKSTGVIGQVNGGIQLAPDGKIYLTEGNNLLTIDNPNDPNASIAIERISLVRPCKIGLPIIMDCMYYKQSVPVCFPPKPNIIGPLEICEGACAQFSDSSTNQPTSWKWRFPGGRPATSDVQNPPPVCYDSAGEYQVYLVVSNLSGEGYIEKTIYVRSKPNIVTDSEIVACRDEPIQLQATGGVRYLWSPAEDLDDPTSATPIIKRTVSQRYIVQGWNTAGCSASDTVEVSIASTIRSFFSVESLPVEAGDTGSVVLRQTQNNFRGSKQISVTFSNQTMQFIEAVVGTVIVTNNGATTTLTITTVDDTLAAQIRFKVWLSSKSATLTFLPQDPLDCRAVSIVPEHTISVINCAGKIRSVRLVAPTELRVLGLSQSTTSQNSIWLQGMPGSTVDVQVITPLGEELWRTTCVLTKNALEKQELHVPAPLATNFVFVIVRSGNAVHTLSAMLR